MTSFLFSVLLTWWGALASVLSGSSWALSSVGDYVPAEVVVVEVEVGGRVERAGEVGGEEALDGAQLVGKEAVQARLDQRHLLIHPVQVRGREDAAPLLVVGGVVGD